MSFLKGARTVTVSGPGGGGGGGQRKGGGGGGAQGGVKKTQGKGKGAWRL